LLGQNNQDRTAGTGQLRGQPGKDEKDDVKKEMKERSEYDRQIAWTGQPK
jgi:hypothetical protein